MLERIQQLKLDGLALKLFTNTRHHTDIFFAIGVLFIIAVLIFPIPAWSMDLLLCISLSISVIVLMTALFIQHPLEFSSFPSVLLVVTMLRLSLNISSTRLILSEGHLGPSAAGYVIEAFGTLVMQNSVLIGVIVFSILTIINFVVITKGSGRIAEVAARFSLDAMPGKQMAIDADLAAGAIDEAGAKKRRKELEDESTFYGSMDGANKFVRGDAIAGIIIILINFIAGVIIGLVNKGMSFESALQTYTVLTIGDGLVAQIPALVVSIAAGLLVTKSGTAGSAEKAIFGQLGNFPHALAVTSGLLAFIGLMPSVPITPFGIISIVLGILSYHLFKVKEEKMKVQEDTQEMHTSATTHEEAISHYMHIDAIKIELGYELLPLLNNYHGTKLTDQIKALRKTMAKDLGFILPSVRIQDNMQIEQTQYVIKIKDMQCAIGVVKPNMYLVMNPSSEEVDIEGEDATEPAFGLKAKWIAEALKEEAVFKEYTVVDAPTVITTHLTEIVKDNITEILSFTETQKLLDSLGDEHKKLIMETIPEKVTLTGLQRVLQGLLSEGVSIRDLPTILESLAEYSNEKSTTLTLIEHSRARLAKQICHSHTNAEGYIPLIVLTPAWEGVFLESLVTSGDEKHLSLAPSKLKEFIAILNKELSKQILNGEMPVLLTSPQIRPYVRSIVQRFRSSIPVMSQNEIHPKAKIKTVGQI